MACGFREEKEGRGVVLTMPIRPENKYRYPSDWKEIVKRIKKRASDRCEWCGAKNYAPHPITGSKVNIFII